MPEAGTLPEPPAAAQQSRDRLLRSVTALVLPLLFGVTAVAALLLSVRAFAGDAPTVQRQAELRNLVEQDCGACHGLRLTGGLGPAITEQALQGKSLEFVEVTIRDGRPGTPMPPWRGLLSETDIAWIADYLKHRGQP
jgi:cytochrome c55X